VQQGLKMIVAGVAVAAAAYVAYAFVIARPPAGADPDDAAQVALGRQVYARECASCHGVNLEGQPDWRNRRPDGKLPAPPHDAEGHTWHHSDDQLFALTKQGIAAFAPPGYRSDMPAYGGKLSDAEIWAVLAYIKSRWPRDIRERQDTATRRAREAR